jgi:hypothetical protein
LEILRLSRLKFCLSFFGIYILFILPFDYFFMMKKLLSPRRFLVASLLCGLFTIQAATQSARASEVVLEDNSVLVAFDSDSGALTRMEDKTTHWVIERRPELGVSFRMFAPLPDRRWNPILGQKQHAVEVKKLSDNEVELKWMNLVSEVGGVLPITFTANVTLNNGVLTFKSTLQNNSPLTVETIEYPYFGDFNPPSRDSLLQACLRKDQEELYPHFANKKGYWGVFYPTKTFEAGQDPYCLLQAPDQGVYVQPDDAKLPYRLEYYFEQKPGVLSGITQLVPPEDEIPGNDQLFGKEDSSSNKNSMTPVHLEFRTCHFVFAPGHSTSQLDPITVRCYSGDKQAGLAIYKQRRSNR